MWQNQKLADFLIRGVAALLHIEYNSSSDDFGTVGSVATRRMQRGLVAEGSRKSILAELGVFSTSFRRSSASCNGVGAVGARVVTAARH